jgi:preprotein translocase subunit SecA
VEYRGRASEMFSQLLTDIRAGVIAQMFKARLVSREELKKMQQAQNGGQNAAGAADEQNQKKKKSRKRH